MFLVTLVGTPSLSDADLRLASETCGGAEAEWLTQGRAADLQLLRADGLRERLEEVLPHADVFVQKRAERARRLFVADMDSTMISVECIDELADYAGLKPQIAEVTEAAMRGELDFEAALRRRVALLGGLASSAIDKCLSERVRFTAGAKTLIATLKAHGIRTVLVSGGFTAFAQPVGEALGFDRISANVLATDKGRLTGGLAGPIVDAEAKRRLLMEETEALGCSPSAAVAIGDGANDLQMVAAAGLGIAFHAKPALAERAGARIRNGDLTTILFALGINRQDWSEPRSDSSKV